MQFPTEPVQRAAGSDRYLVPQAVLVRAAAYLIDTFLLSLLAAPFLYSTNTHLDFTAASVTTVQLAVLAGMSAYFFLWEGAVGWTPGKRLLQLRVVRVDGGRCSWLQSLVRNLLRPVDLLFFGVIGILSIATGLKRQRLGDRLAGTIVVRALPLPLVPFPYVPADQATRRCPSCGALQPAERTACILCGADLEHGRPSASAPWPSVEDVRSRLMEREADERAGGGHYAQDLESDDESTRLIAAREVLLKGESDDIEALVHVLADWHESDVQFVVTIARTLDGWRPVTVLEALQADPDPAISAAAEEALRTVEQRNRERGHAPQDARDWEDERAEDEGGP